MVRRLRDGEGGLPLAGGAGEGLRGTMLQESGVRAPKVRRLLLAAGAGVERAGGGAVRVLGPTLSQTSARPNTPETEGAPHHAG